jgi:ATP-dependent protease Clp ATPase subunit
MLNANATKMWKEDILSGKSGSLTYGVSKLQEIVNNMVLGNEVPFNNVSNNGTTIENIELTMNATIANDYDARRAGENIVDEIMKIARKSSVSSIRR